MSRADRVTAFSHARRADFTGTLRSNVSEQARSLCYPFANGILLAFHGTGGEASDYPVLEDHDQDDERDRHDHGSRHN